MISTTSNRISYAGNGATTVFSFPFKWTASAAVKVILRDDRTAEATYGDEVVKTLTTHYTLSATSGAAGTGSVTMLSAPATGFTLVIVPIETYLQATDYVENSAMPAEVQEAALDKLTMLTQQLKDKADRSVKLTEGFSDTFTTDLPSTVDGKAGYLLGLNPTEDGFIYVDPTTVTSGVAWGGITGTLSDQTDLQSALDLKANLASPTFTGVPAAPTAAPGTNTTQVASTAFVTTAVASASVSDGDKGDITVSGSGATWSVDANAITNAKSAQMATLTIKGNNTGGASDPLDLTVAQTAAILPAMVGDSGAGGTKGLVPAPATGDTAAGKYLKADGTWAVPPGGGGTGDVVGPASAVDNAVARYDSTTGKLIQDSKVTVDDNGRVMTMNVGNGASTAASTGVELNENSVITGYLRTAADRLSWIMKPPGNGGIFKFLSASGAFNSIFSGSATADRTYGLPDYNLNLGRTSSTFTGTSVTPTAAIDETFLYNAGSAQSFSTTGFGTLTSLPNGYRATIMGSSDTNTLSIADSDISNGRLMNGDAVLGIGMAITFEYNSTLARMVEISRNF